MTSVHRVLIAVGVSLLFLAAFLYKVDLGEVVRDLGQADYRWLIPAVALDLVGVWFRTLRWRVLLGHMRDGLRLGKLYKVVIVGFAANNLFPLRLGEVVRAYYLSRKEPISGAAGLATIVVERVIDGVALLCFVILAAPFIPVPNTLAGLAQGVGVPTGVLVAAASLPFIAALAFLFVLAIVPGRALPVAAFILRVLPGRLRGPATGLVERFVLGLGALRSPRRAAGVFVLTLPIWITEAGMYLSAAYAFGIPQALGSWQAVVGMTLLITAVSNLATAIPAAQGSVGTFDFFAAATAVALGAAPDMARAYAIALHMAMFVPVTLLGLLVLWGENLSLWQLLRESRGHQTAEAPSRTPPTPPTSVRRRIAP